MTLPHSVFQLRFFAFFLICVCEGRASENAGLAITVTPREIRGPLIGGFFGTRSVTITLRNSSREAVILDGQAGVQFELVTRDGVIPLGAQALPADPLQLSPGGELTLMWQQTIKAKVRLPVPLLARVRLTGDGAQAIVGEALYRPPPGWVMALQEKWLYWLLALLGARVMLGIFRIQRRPASVWRRIPLTGWDHCWLSLCVRLIDSLSCYSLPRATRRWLLMPVLSSLRYFTVYGKDSSPRASLCVAIGDRLVKDLPPESAVPANPVFVFHWHAALAFDAAVRASDNYVDLTAAASVLAERYRAAAPHAGEDELRGLASAAESFYSAVASHFAGTRKTASSAVPSEVCTSPTQLLQTAAARLRAGEISSAETGMAGLAVLEWVDAGACGWPPPLVLRADVDQRAVNFLTFLELDQAVEGGDVLRGLRLMRRLETERDPSLGRNTATAVASPIYRLLSLNLRFHLAYPVGEGMLRLAKEGARDAINDLQTDGRWNQSLGLTSWAAAMSADLCRLLGDRHACLLALHRVSFDQGTDRWAMEARALASGVRSELYGECGEIQAAIRASRTAALWSALLGDFVGWRRLRAIAAKQALDGFEQGLRVRDDAKAALSELVAIECSARCFARKGWPDLFAGLQLWARYIIAIDSEDHCEISDLSRFHRWTSAGWTRFDVMLSSFAKRVLPAGTGAWFLSQNIITAMGRRFSHAVSVLCGFHHMEHHLSEHPHAAGKIIRLADAHLKKGNLDLPQPLIMQHRAQISLAWLASGQGPPALESATSACEYAILSVLQLVKERAAAPTDALQRSAGVQRNTVIETLIHTLSVVQPVLDPQTFQRFSSEAYNALQSLRIEGWENLRRGKEVTTISQPDAPIADLSGLGVRLTSFLDRLALAGGRITGELRPQWEALLSEVPELGHGNPVEQLQAAQRRSREKLGELIRGRVERITSDSPRIPPPIASTPAQLPHGHAWIEYFISPRRACAFVTTSLRPNPEFIPLSCIQVPDLAGIARSSMNSVRAIRSAGRDLGAPMPADAAVVKDAAGKFEQALGDLSAKLWPRQLHERLVGCENIHIVPWGTLWRVPFPALATPEGTPLVCERIISISPFGPLASNDVSPWNPPSSDEIVLLAHDVGRATEHRLEKLDEEVSRLRVRFPSAMLLRDENATPDAALFALRHYRWLHIACHGQSDRDSPMFSRLALARSALSPDGSLYLHQLESAASALEGVFLSACESNLGGALGDRPETLAFGFVSIGAQTVVATLGEIFDDVALIVTDHFYEELQRHPPETAMCLALRRFISATEQNSFNGMPIQHNHPILWWPFVLISGR